MYFARAFLFLRPSPPPSAKRLSRRGYDPRSLAIALGDSLRDSGPRSLANALGDSLRVYGLRSLAIALGDSLRDCDLRSLAIAIDDRISIDRIYRPSDVYNRH